MNLLQAALNKLAGNVETTVRVQKQRLQPLFIIFAKALRIDLLVLFFSGSAHAKFENFSTTINKNVLPSLNTLPLIINATDDSTTTLEITTNKAMQRVP